MAVGEDRLVPCLRGEDGLEVNGKGKAVVERGTLVQDGRFMQDCRQRIRHSATFQRGDMERLEQRLDVWHGDVCLGVRGHLVVQHRADGEGVGRP